MNDAATNKQIADVLQLLAQGDDERNQFTKLSCLLCNEFHTETDEAMQSHLLNQHACKFPLTGLWRLQIHSDSTDYFENIEIFVMDDQELARRHERIERDEDDMFRYF